MAFRWAGDRADGTPQDNEHRVRTAQTALNRTLQDFATDASRGNFFLSMTHAYLKTVRASLRTIDNFLDQQLGPDRYGRHCPPHAEDIAQRVFDIPELLESILRQLDINHLLGAQMVNRQFRDAVDGSIKLQRKLSLVPHSSQHFFAPFAEGHFPGLTFVEKPKHFQWESKNTKDYELSAEEKQHSIKIQARFDLNLPRLGSRCRRMMLVQPPLQEITAHMNCCIDQNYPIMVVQNPMGVTLGDLLDASAKLNAEHRSCSNAAESRLSFQDGFVEVQVTYQARIVLGAGDPFLQAKKDSAARQWQRGRVGHKIAAFREAKVSAGRAREVTPELEEWEKGYGPYEEQPENFYPMSWD